MIVLLAVDNGLDKSVSQSVITMKFPDDTEFQFGKPANGWVCFTARSAQKNYYFQAAYVIAIMADDQPALDALTQFMQRPQPGLSSSLSPEYMGNG